MTFSIPPLFFIVVFWGEKHRTFFLDFCLSSLLAAGNIPVLGKKNNSRFIICSPKTDWEKIQSHPTFLLAKSYIRFMHIDLAVPDEPFNKLLLMSKGHKQGSSIAYREAARAVFLTPDMLFSHDCVTNLQRISKANKKVVLCCAVRFDLEACINSLKKRFIFSPGTPLTLPAIELADVAIDCMHSETKQFEWNKSYFADYPVACFWRIRPFKALVIHSFSWAPLLVDYSSLKSHNTSTFEKWTLDGDYIFKNFRSLDDIYVVQDSREIMLVTLTSELELNYRLTRHILKFGIWGNWTKTNLLRRVFFAPEMDDLKRSIFSKQVFWIGKQSQKRLFISDITRAQKAVTQKSKNLIAKAISARPTGRTDYVYLITAYGWLYSLRLYIQSLKTTIPIRLQQKRLGRLDIIKKVFGK